MAIPEFYSVIKSEKLNQLTNENKKYSSSQKTNDIFISPIKKTAIETYGQIQTILMNDVLPDNEKLNQIKQLKFNFDSNFAKIEKKTIISTDSIQVEKNIENIEKDIFEKVQKTKKYNRRTF